MAALGFLTDLAWRRCRDVMLSPDSFLSLVSKVPRLSRVFASGMVTLAAQRRRFAAVGLSHGLSPPTQPTATNI